MTAYRICPAGHVGFAIGTVWTIAAGISGFFGSGSFVGAVLCRSFTAELLSRWTLQ
jgi:hypothetical protein